MLMLHTAQLFTFVPPKQGGSSNAEAVANYLVSLIAFVALGLAVYIWYYYQPMYVAFVLLTIIIYHFHHYYRHRGVILNFNFVLQGTTEDGWL